MTEVETARLATEAAGYDAAYRLDMRLGQIGTYLEKLGLGDAGKILLLTKLSYRQSKQNAS